LFDLVSQIQGDFLMTYDNTKDVCQMARRYHFDMRLVPMKNTHHTNMAELLIGRDLSWLNLPQPEADPTLE
jgi:DNA adenine methylase